MAIGHALACIDQHEFYTDHYPIHQDVILKSIKILLIALAAYVPAAFAGTKAHQEPGMLFYVLAAIVVPIVLYTANKWRLWGLGFKFGMASKSTFLGSVKWTFASVIVTVVSVAILAATGSI